jgi:hypothetical protein
MATANDLYEAILTNSVTAVNHYLKAGGVDPNQSPVLKDARDAQDGQTYFVVSDGPNYRISPLHVAVLICWFVDRQSSLAIVGALLDAGADATLKTENIHISNGLAWVELAPVAPLELAVFVKKFAPGRRFEVLDSAIKKIVQRAEAKALHATPASQMKPVPVSVVKTWSDLLLSEDFSDVQFVCEDGTVLHAHKAILAAASPYFSCYFKGPWGELHPHGRWQTTNSPDVMKAALSFIYTGEIADSKLIDKQGPAVLSLASEYQLPNLLQLAESSCIRDLSMDTIKPMLQVAHVHRSKHLKRACFEFVRRNAARCMTDSNFMTLAAECPDLWVKLAKAIAPDSENQGPNTKRRRQT